MTKQVTPIVLYRVYCFINVPDPLTLFEFDQFGLGDIQGIFLSIEIN